MVPKLKYMKMVLHFLAPETKLEAVYNSKQCTHGTGTFLSAGKTPRILKSGKIQEKHMEFLCLRSKFIAYGVDGGRVTKKG